MVPFGPTDESLLYELVVREGEQPEHPEDPTITKAGLTDAMWLLIERSWAPDPDQRPSTSDIRDETLQFIGGLDTPSNLDVEPLSSPDEDQMLSLPLNEHLTDLPKRMSLAAVSYGNILLIYVQNTTGDIQEFSCGAPPALAVRWSLAKTGLDLRPLQWFSSRREKVASSLKYSLTPTKMRRSVSGSGMAAFGVRGNL